MRLAEMFAIASATIAERLGRIQKRSFLAYFHTMEVREC